MKRVIGILFALMLLFTISGCINSADVVSSNISQKADNFEILRRVVFYNGITGEYMLTIEGFCSLGNNDKAGELTVTCKVGEDKYIKDSLGLSDNVTYFLEQIDSANVNKDHYVVVFKPTTIIPGIVVNP